MSKKVLIVGGGLAGTIIANGLVRHIGDEIRKGDVSITMLGTTDTHMYQPGLLYIPFGKIRERELFRPQRKVLDKRIIFHIDPATNIDVENKKVTCNSGTVHDYDYLVIATGSRLMPQNIPGLAEGAH